MAVDPAGRVPSVGQGREGGASGQSDTQNMAFIQGVAAGAGGTVDVRVGPGLEAVSGGGPSVSDDEGQGASLEHLENLPRQRRTSVPHNLRSTIRSPAEHFAADRHANSHPPHAAEHGTTSRGQMRDPDARLNEDTRRAIRERYMSYDRAYRPAFSRNLSSSDESDELSLDRDLDCSRLHRGGGGEEGHGDGDVDGDGEGETDEVESLPTPGLDTAGGMEMQIGLAAGHAGKTDMVQVLGGEEELDVTGEGETGAGTGLGLERPGLEERGSDETVKGTETLDAPGEQVL